jgi:hypothetical protein
VIQLEAIRIQEFRGIRELELRFNRKSFAIWGPNGSGKSGVVDAIDFALTGNVSRLSGSGTGGLSVARHGPHVHKRDDASASEVALTIYDAGSGQRSILTRNVKTANKFLLDPDTPEIRAAVERTQQHPELTLSRREIIKYVVAKSGKRAQEVQALLKLDRVGEIRRLLRTVQTKATGSYTEATSELTHAESAFKRHIDLPKVDMSEVARRINGKRSILGLASFDAVTFDTDLQSGPGRTRLLGDRDRPGQPSDPVHDVRRLRGQPQRADLPGHIVDHARHDRTCVDIQAYTRTLRQHRRLP